MRDTGCIAKALPSLEAIPVLSSDAASLSERVRLDETDRRVLSGIDDKTSIGEILSVTGMEKSEVIRAIFAMVNIGMVKLKAPAGADAGNEDFAGHRRQRPALDPEVLREIDEMHGNYIDLGYYGVLGVKPHASFPEIKTAYYRAAKKFHPDIHFNVANGRLREKMSDIFSYIYEAYSTLGDPKRRKEYDSSISFMAKRPASGRERAKSRFEEGRTALRKKLYAEAELLFGQAAYFDSSVADYHFYYGLALFGQNKLKAAEKAMARALKIEPFNAEYLAELGFVFAELGFPARAKGLFEKALKISPENKRAASGAARMKSL
jgi:tetratricopeptide (TPR) repeat protein